FQDFEACPMRRGSLRAATSVLALAPARRQGGAEAPQPTVEGHGRFSHPTLVCDTMEEHLPGAQTVRRGGAGPAGACLAVGAPPAAFDHARANSGRSRHHFLSCPVSLSHCW